MPIAHPAPAKPLAKSVAKSVAKSDAKSAALRRLKAHARPTVDVALGASLAGYDRLGALSRFHRLSRETILSETPEAARAVLREIEQALRKERARRGHWTYDLNRHIALLVAHRAESARLAGIGQSAEGLFSSSSS